MSKSGENPEISGKDQGAVRFGPFLVDSAQRRLARGRTAIHLTPKAFDLLMFLVHEAPRVVTKRELHERLWPDSFVSDASLTALVKELRRGLGDRNQEAPVIRTVHRVGYALSLEVERDTKPPAGTAHWLVIAGRREALTRGENIVGRDPEAGVWLDAAGVSRRHACITIDATGARLEDLGSKNGTTVGGASIADATPLRDGDRIGFGGLAAVYRCSSAGLSTETRRSAGVGRARTR